MTRPASGSIPGSGARHWRLRVDGPQPGAVNMEIDRALLRLVEAEAQPTTWLRLFQWSRPTVSLGRHQKPEDAVDLNCCRRHGVDVVTRPTGGRAVFHDQELTYSVVSNDAECFPDQTIGGTYRRIAQALLEGLRRLGVDAELVRSPTGQPAKGPGGSIPCFATASRHEILCRGRKLVGSAQCRLRRGFLQHGSIPVRLKWELMADVFRIPMPRLRTGMIDLHEAAGTISIPRLEAGLIEGFALVFQAEMRTGEPLPTDGEGYVTLSTAFGARPRAVRDYEQGTGKQGTGT